MADTEPDTASYTVTITPNIGEWVHREFDIGDSVVEHLESGNATITMPDGTQLIRAVCIASTYLKK